MPSEPLSRRSLLKGAAAGVAVTALESMSLPQNTAWAALPLGRSQVAFPLPSTKCRSDIPAYDDAGANRVDLAGARNSAVIGQIMVTSPPDAVTTVTVTAGVLTGPSGATLVAPDVLVQLSVNASKPANPAVYPAGRYFDALPPLSAVGPWTIAAGQVGGIVVKYTIPAAALPGTYSGSVLLSAGGSTVTVPVSVVVWAASLPTTPTIDTAFAVWYSQVGLAHHVDWGTPAWDNVAAAYFEFQAASRLTADDAPIEGKPVIVSTPSGPGVGPGPGPDPDPAAYLARVQQYVDDPRVRAFRIPMYASDNPAGGWTIDTTKLKQVVDGLNTMGLLGRGYFYYFDEPSTAQQFAYVNQASAVVAGVAPGVPNIVTIPGIPSQSTVNDLKSTCTWQHRIYADQPNVTASLKARGDKVWSYMMVQDNFPWVNSFVDDSLVGTRLLPLAHHLAGSDGILNWTTTCFGNWNGSAYVSDLPAAQAFWDRYGNPYPLTPNAGDGYLLYPGAMYGIAGPVSSLRFESLREGVQDLELVRLHAATVANFRQSWGVTDHIGADPLALTTRVMIRWLDQYRNDSAVLERLRRDLGAELTALAGGLPVLVDVPEARGYAVKVRIAAPYGASVSVNGSSVAMTPRGSYAIGEAWLALPPTGSGAPGVVTVVASQGTSTTTINRQVYVDLVGQTRNLVVNSFETDADLQIPTVGCTVTRGVDHATAGLTAAKITYPANSAFASFQLTSTILGATDVSIYRALEMDIYNPQNQILVMAAKFFNTSNQTDDEHPLYLSPGANKVYIPLDKVRVGLNLNKIEFWLWAQPTQTTLYVDNIRLVTRRPQATKSLLATGPIGVVDAVSGSGSVALLRWDGSAWTTSKTTMPAGTGTLAQEPAIALSANGVPCWVLTAGSQFLFGFEGNPTVLVAQATTALERVSAVLDGGGNIVAFARGSDGGLYLAKCSADGVVSAPVAVTIDGVRGAVNDAPQCTLTYGEKVAFMVINGNGTLVFCEQDTLGGTNFTSRPVGISIPAGRPALARRANGVITCMIRSTDGSLAAGWQNPDGTWRATAVAPAGSVVGDPTLVLDTTCVLKSMTRTGAGQILIAWQPAPGEPLTWQTKTLMVGSTPATSTGPLTAAVANDGNLHLMSRESATTVLHYSRVAPSSPDWQSRTIIIP
ncbi:glycoside hydrolase domain-containing protein [Kribbella sp. GL6]|uniref:glycoside hydrolase domain-containing protein n=1 Tax=Kribbella sp. GL6 TaxID=3419765 RepID=UPI003D04BF17